MIVINLNLKIELRYFKKLRLPRFRFHICAELIDSTISCFRMKYYSKVDFQLNHGDDEEAPFLASDNPDFDFENEDALANDIKNLRKLDALIGRAELAAMTNEEVNIEDDLPEIEEELKSIDAVELVNPDKQFFDVADDLRHRSKEFR